MKGQTEALTLADGVASVSILGAFFLDIAGVFGLVFAISSMLIAIGMVIAFCFNRAGRNTENEQ